MDSLQELLHAGIIIPCEEVLLSGLNRLMKFRLLPSDVPLHEALSLIGKAALDGSLVDRTNLARLKQVRRCLFRGPGGAMIVPTAAELGTVSFLGPIIDFFPRHYLLNVRLAPLLR